MSSPSPKPIRPKHFKWLIGSAIGIGVATLLAIAAISVIQFTKSPNQDKIDASKDRASSLLKDVTEVSKQTTRTIVSDLGFSTTYDTSSLTAYGQYTDPSSDEDYISGMSYENEELDEKRAYSIVRIQPKQIAESNPTVTQDLSIVTNIRKAYWDTRSDAEKGMASKLDILTARSIADHTMEQDESVETTPNVQVGNITYTKITYTTDRSKYGIATPYVSTVYVTVQNDRPYTLTISDTLNDKALTTQYEALIAGIVYATPDISKLGYKAPTVTLAAKTTDFELPKHTSNTLEELSPDSLLSIVAVNQPATIRILTVDCSDITLRSDSSSFSLKNACGAMIGSGSFISGDGYVATNGHVVTSNPKSNLVNSLASVQHVEELVQFLVSDDKIKAEQAEAFLSALKAGDRSAASAVPQLAALIDDSAIKISNRDTAYVLQLGNDPIRINKDGDRPKPIYSTTVIEASFIDMNYDEEASNAGLREGGQFTTSDVAILKAEGAFPSVKLGSIDELKPGDQLTAIGFPGFVDNGISTEQLQTVPSITQGRLNSVVKDNEVDGRYLLLTNVPIAQGNSGGPSFNSAGEQIGLNTYGTINCPDLNCFGSGTVRDIEDIKKLLKENRIKLKESTVSESWSRGLEAYSNGNYKVALAAFEKQTKDYPANYLASPLARLARQQIGSETDTSGDFASRDTIVVLSIVAGAGVLVATGLTTAAVILSRRHKKALTATSATPPVQPIL